MLLSALSIGADVAPVADCGRSVILVEDEPDLRHTVTEYLTQVGFQVTAVDNGLRFYHALAESNFAAAVIDLGLPDIDGLHLVEYLRNNSTMPCIILTARTSVDDRISGYDCGADIYLCKPVDGRELAAALNRITQRGRQDMTADKSRWRLSGQAATLITPASEAIPLTAKEMDFLRCLGRASGETVPRAAILDDLGYQNDEFSNRALESLIRRLRRKIESVCGSSPILTRHAVGYSFSAPLVME